MKQRVLKEVRLGGAVMAWLRSRGFGVYTEVGFYNHPVDIVGLQKGVIIAVELKCGLTRGVIHQAYINTLFAHQSWCAVATNPRPAGLAVCTKHGLGVLRVEENEATVILASSAAVGAHRNPSSTQHMIEVLGHMEPGGEAGKPNLKGEGPAQDVERAVIEYRKAQPKATWQEIYDNVPNHYASKSSLSNSMRLVRERRAWQKRVAEERKRKCKCGHTGDEHKKPAGFYPTECKLCECRYFEPMKGG